MNSAAAYFKKNWLTLESGIQLYLKSLNFNKDDKVPLTPIPDDELSPELLEATTKLDKDWYDNYLKF